MMGVVSNLEFSKAVGARADRWGLQGMRECARSRATGSVESYGDWNRGCIAGSWPQPIATLVPNPTIPGFKDLQASSGDRR
jgi:hypothetical protein